ncbi:MAG: glycosyltransferase family 2 protein, partial [Candidatus Hodarchaeota archaeon]
MSIKISFILLTWNSEKYLGKCLNSLLANLRGSQFSHEVFIVDNGSKDTTVPMINSYLVRHPDVIVPIFLETNKGTTDSRNLGLRRARGRYIGIMDSDVEIPEGTIIQLVSTLEENENAGLVAPKVVYPNGNYQKSTDALPTVFTKLFRWFFLKSIEKKEKSQKQKVDLCEVDYAISAMWMLKSELLQIVGLLDENIFYAPEDLDYCVRVRQAGYKVLYDPRVAVVHHAQEISRGLRINRATVSHLKGLA